MSFPKAFEEDLGSWFFMSTTYDGISQKFHF